MVQPRNGTDIELKVVTRLPSQRESSQKFGLVSRRIIIAKRGKFDRGVDGFGQIDANPDHGAK